ncbi:GyrI-like domain-containing protein [Candidatus Fermentibacteria bacterium]|nr:GyrI-like domain-containing protein [Candidatus Fermentibacteria bacterium]
MNAEIRNLPPMTVLCAGREGSLSTLPGAFERLFRYLSGRHVEPGPDLMTIHNADPVASPFGRLQSEAAVSLGTGHQPDAPGISVKVLPGGTYAVYRHTGPYSSLMTAWVRFREALGELIAGPQAGPFFEVYVSDPETTPESDLVTELYCKVLDDGMPACS